MKNRYMALCLCSFLFACTSPLASPPKSATLPAPVETPASFSNPQIDALLKNKCKKAWESPVGPGVSDHLRNTYGDMDCKFPIFSPDEEYLAYVALSQAESKPAYVDTVKIIKPHTGAEKAIHFASDKNFIGKLEWSSTGKLLIWELIWEGPWVIFIYDPVTDTPIYIFRLDQDGKLEWNPQRTIFYASHSGEYGLDGCITELSGYDFQFNNRFPDFYELYGLEKRNDDPFGIPYGKNDNLFIAPFTWSTDGHSLFITVTPLTLLKNDYYKQEPTQAGRLDFSNAKVSFAILGADPQLDYFFKEVGHPKLTSEPYNLTYCPPR